VTSEVKVLKMFSASASVVGASRNLRLSMAVSSSCNEGREWGEKGRMDGVYLFDMLVRTNASPTEGADKVH
jgi:hypothetical protein